ncbi:sensor histidine kinase [Agrococcus jejuensis]|uniref:Oxygen sensor histidine kinase NreB n=1 Tax=Agrococcus jejuensis TaxID=399736 RepID=A0A1G8H9Q9_9MICO|nr:ATP-binding protein [Agrococcus jejuensis]SDI03404.1 Signal transduction histidine kinase [Agrococcus jejuensis]
MDPSAARSRVDPSRSTRWADLAVVVMIGVVGVLLVVTPVDAVHRVIGAGAMALLAVTWIVMRRDLEVGLAGSAARTAALAAVGFCCTLAAPWLAIAQAILHPLVWLGGARRRYGIVGSAALCAAVAAGWIVREPSDWWAAVAVQLGSWGFSVWFGLWIASIDRLSTERQQLVEALRATRDEVAALAGEQGARSERDRIAREIHDTIAQDLVGVVMLLEGVRAGASGADAVALERAELAARRSLADARALVAGEIAIEVDGRRLHAAIREVVGRWSIDTGIPATVALESAALGREAQVVVVRSLQEALSNVRRHAHARAVAVTLHVDRDAAVLHVDDDGTGIPEAPDDPGFGLAAMRRRAALAGGSASTAASPTGGARVEIRVPIEEAS